VISFLEWWSGLSAWVRYPVALLVIGGSMIGFATGWWPLGRLWGLGLALGFVLLWFGSRAK